MLTFYHYFLALMGRDVSGAVLKSAWLAFRRGWFQNYKVSYEYNTEEFWIAVVSSNRELVELWIIQYCIDNNL